MCQRLSTLLAAFLVAFAMPAAADTVTYAFTVTVEATRGQTATWFPGLVGETISGWYVFHDDLPNLDPSPASGEYVDMAGAIDIDIRDSSYMVPNLAIQLYWPTNSHYTVQGPGGSLVIYFYLQAYHEVLTSNALPVEVPDLSLWDGSNKFVIDFGGPDNNIIVGNMETLDLVDITPTSSTPALAHAGAAR